MSLIQGKGFINLNAINTSCTFERKVRRVFPLPEPVFGVLSVRQAYPYSTYSPHPDLSGSHHFSVNLVVNDGCNATLIVKVSVLLEKHELGECPREIDKPMSGLSFRRVVKNVPFKQRKMFQMALAKPSDITSGISRSSTQIRG